MMSGGGEGWFERGLDPIAAAAAAAAAAKEVDDSSRLQPRKGVVVVAHHKPKPMETNLQKKRGMVEVAAEMAAATGTRLTPVGRLDRNTTGLLIWTNDGKLTVALNSWAEKEYRIAYISLRESATAAIGTAPTATGARPSALNDSSRPTPPLLPPPTATGCTPAPSVPRTGALTEAEVAALLQGVHLEKEDKEVRFERVALRPDLAVDLPPIVTTRRRRLGTPSPATATATDNTTGGTVLAGAAGAAVDQPEEVVHSKTRHFVDVTLVCGVYHVVKRVFQHCTGRAVSDLHRVRVNQLRLQNIAGLECPGSFCVLTPDQIDQLSTSPL
jgi:16S rRNA U516 pseudouridylate synthase RsuA-like enzyme